MMRPMDVNEEEEEEEEEEAEEEEEEEEEYERLHDYDERRYTEIVNLINEEHTSSPDYHARRVVGEACRIEKPLNLMNDSVLHEVIARRKTRLAVAIVDLPDALNHSILRHQNYYGDTPLHIAVEIGDSTVANALLRRDEMLARQKNRKGEMPLQKAVQFDRPDLFDFMIKVGGREMVYDRTDDGFTILHHAIKRNQTKIALDIARKFPELILTRNVDGATPLQMMAVYFRKPPKTGILNSLLYKYIPLEKGTSLEEGMTDEESGGIMPPDQGNWWSRLSVISNLRKRIVKAREEMPSYEMTMELLKLLLVVEGFEFYIMGFTAQSSIKRTAGGSHIRLPLLAGKKSGALIVKGDDDRPDQVPQVNGRIRWEESPLITGIKLGLDDFVIKILQVRPELATYLDYDGTNVLQAAVKYGRRRVVNAIKDDKRLPLWLLSDLESDTNNTLLHIAASNPISEEADPLRLQDELEWFEMLGKIIPPDLWNHRNISRMTAQEVFYKKHEETLTDSRVKLAEIGCTCSPLLAAVVFTSSFNNPGENNREGGLAFKIFSHVYVLAFSCGASSLVMFLLLSVTPFRLRDFRRLVPWHYLMACFFLAMSLFAFIVAFPFDMYLQIYGQKRKTTADLATLLLDFLVPFLCALVLSLSAFRSPVLRRLTK